MKKTNLLVLILFFVFVFNLNVFGQSSNIGDTTSSGLDISVDDGGVPNDPALQANKLNYIDTRFCNDGIEQEKLTQNLSMVIRPGEEKEICIIHLNRSKEDIYVLGSFPENQIYPNGSSDCSTNNTRDNPFSKFIQPFENELIKVPAKGYVITKTTIKFPIGINGLQRGCYAYSANQGKLVEGEMFSIVTRKVHYIDVLVQGDDKIDSKLEINNITSKIDENNKLGIDLVIENNGSIDETIDINGELSSIFGYTKSFSVTGIIVGTNSKKAINIKDFGVDVELPRYNGLFSLDLKINHKPYFSFDISNSGIDPEILKGGVFDQSESIFIFPTLPAIGLLVLIVLIYFAFFKKPRVIIQQVPVSTPTPQ